MSAPNDRLRQLASFIPSKSSASSFKNMASTLAHPTLETAFHGTNQNSPYSSQSTTSYRGIQYGSIPERFAEPEMVTSYNKEVDATTYGPRCPQRVLDPAHLLRIPEADFSAKLSTSGAYPTAEDEFSCLNLDIVVPDISDEQKKGLPVLIWIHGGSQIITFASPNTGICDLTRIVADSAAQNKPIIAVSLNYRLNLFAFGEGSQTGSKTRNLALKDQRLGIEWVRKYISGFGGDAENITIYGESAGGIYVHAQIVTDAPVKRAIMSSGSLYLSSPLPVARGDAYLGRVLARVQELGGPEMTLKNAPVEIMIKVQNELSVDTLWLQYGPEFEGWEQKTGQVNSVMVGDAEYESVIWRNGIETMSADQISTCFDQLGSEKAPLLKKLYGIVSSRPTACKLGALDFINDSKFAWPSQKIADLWSAGGGKKAYRYVFDQANPWQTSARAHHATDVLLLFGGYDLSEVSPAADAVGQEMRSRWIAFACGENPWTAAGLSSGTSDNSAFAFGPLGESKEIDQKGMIARRRVRSFQEMENMDIAKINAAFAGLAAGRISLYN